MGSKLPGSLAILLLFLPLLLPFAVAEASYHFSNYRGRPPIHIYGKRTVTPEGFSPDAIKHIYNLPASRSSGGTGTIAIVTAYDAIAIESDLAVFNTTFHLPACTVRNGCLTVHKKPGRMRTDPNWELETALDVEWAHAIAPSAKILLVQAATPSGRNLLAAVRYAAKQASVVAISMSWGGREFPEETLLDKYLASDKIAFFAASGDDGTGVSWPAASKYVIGVGGTSLSSKTERAWEGSGGGISSYEQAPDAQRAYNIPRAHGMRAVPDVAYNADPVSGFAVYHAGGWHRVGGTSAGAPQWAAIAALAADLGNRITIDRLYAAPANSFREIRTGTNGHCGYLCKAHKGYNFITGLGVPQTAVF